MKVRNSLPPSPADFLPLPARDFYILFFLAQGERHGYGLVKEIDEHSSGAVRLDPANLYRAIQRLGNAGLVADASRRAVRDSGHQRRYYRITALGREVVAAEAIRMRDLATAVADERLIPDSKA